MKGDSMNGKPDNFVRFLLLLIVCLLTAQVYIQFFYPVGRYIQMSYTGEAMVAVLDTRSGKVYIHTKDVGGVIDVVEKAKERAKQQPKDGKP
jgi:hypothetical protein